MAETALDAAPEALAGFSAALRARDRAAFERATRLLLEQLPRTLFKRSVKGERAGLREAVYHAALFGALTACAPPGVDVQPQASTHCSVADIVIRFAGAASAGGSTSADDITNGREESRSSLPTAAICATRGVSSRT
jgi:hypothetical protein